MYEWRFGRYGTLLFTVAPHPDPRADNVYVDAIELRAVLSDGDAHDTAVSRIVAAHRHPLTVAMATLLSPLDTSASKLDSSRRTPRLYGTVPTKHTAVDALRLALHVYYPPLATDPAAPDNCLRFFVLSSMV